MTWIKANAMNIILIGILAAGAWFRLVWYGDLRSSISTAETYSYITSSRAPLFSWKIFAGKRLFSTNLIFKLANDEQSCPLAPFSNPALGAEGFRENRPCFDKIVILQTFLSIFGWSLLAWTTARWIKNPFIKIATVILVILFAFTPQIAEWDSILSPESLTFSLLIISFALLQEVALRSAATDNRFDLSINPILFVAYILTLLLWIFVRDIHLYAIVALLALIIPLLFLNKYQQSKFLITSIVVLVGALVLGYLSAKDSLRATRYPLEHAFDAYVWPYPARAKFIEGFGMPARESPEFQAWFDINATKIYGLFLISHPGFLATTLWKNFDQLKSDSIQPYFNTSDIKHRDNLLQIGEIVHPETGAVYLIDILLLISLFINAVKYRIGALFAWSWLAAWFFLVSAITLISGFFGDIDGTRRHIMPSIEMFRLFLWIFLMPLLDTSQCDLATT